MKKGDKNIRLLGASSFFNDIGSEMITPVLPFYVTALGGTGFAVGLLSGLREGLSSLFKLIGGWLSDRYGKRRPFVFLGYFLSILFRFLLAAATTWQQIIGYISFERLGKLRDPPRDAIISASSKKYGRAFGIHQMMDTFGGVIGTIIVLLLFWKLNLEFSSIILIAALVSILSLVPLFFVKESKIKKIKKTLIYGIKHLDKRLKYFIFVTAVFTLANFGLYMFLLLRAREITGNILIPLILYVIFNIVYAVFTVPFGNLSDKIGRKKVLISGYFLFLIVSFIFIYSSVITYLLISFILYGLVFAMTQSNQRALVADLSGKMKATAMGFYYAVIGLVNIPAGIIAGLLWDVSYKVMFYYISVIAALALILILFIREK